MANPNNVVSIGALSGHARPTRALLGRIAGLQGPKTAANISAMLDDMTAADSLARLLTEAIEKNTAKDGRIDMRDVAVFVLAEMRKHPR